MQDITDAELDQVLQANDVVLVDFWAQWCGPCRAIAPVVQELAGEYNGRVVMIKVNVDDNRQAVAKFQISSIPTLLLIKKGQVVDKIVGAGPATDKDSIKARIDRVL